MIDAANFLPKFNNHLPSFRVKYILKKEYPNYYRLFSERTWNRYSIVNIEVDFNKIFLEIHRNSYILNILPEFIDEYNPAKKLELLTDIYKNSNCTYLIELLITYTNPSYNDGLFLVELSCNDLPDLFKLLLNDKRLDLSIKEEENLLLFYS